MFEIGQARVIEEEDTEVKVIPMNDDVFLLQISSGIIRGTLALDKSVQKDELVEFGEAIYELIQQFSMYDINDPDELPQ